MKKLLLALILFSTAVAFAVDAGGSSSGTDDVKSKTVETKMEKLENTLWCGVRREPSGEDMLMAYEFLPDGQAFMIWVWLPRSDAKEASGAIMLGAYAIDVKYEDSSSGVTIKKHDGEQVFHYRNGSLIHEEDGRRPFSLTQVGVSLSTESERSPSERHLPSILQHLSGSPGVGEE